MEIGVLALQGDFREHFELLIMPGLQRMQAQSL